MRQGKDCVVLGPRSPEEDKNRDIPDRTFEYNAPGIRASTIMTPEEAEVVRRVVRRALGLTDD